MTVTDIVIHGTDVVIKEKDENMQRDNNSQPRSLEFISF